MTQTPVLVWHLNHLLNQRPLHFQSRLSDRVRVTVDIKTQLKNLDWHWGEEPFDSSCLGPSRHCHFVYTRRTASTPTTNSSLVGTEEETKQKKQFKKTFYLLVDF